MAKIDRLRWESGIAIEAFGVKLGIRVNTPDALAHIPAYLPPEWQPTASSEVDHLCSMIWGGSPTRRGVRRYHLLYSGPGRVARTMQANEMLEELASALDFRVAVLSPEKVFVHAGVVAWNNRAILIPGRTHSGKTTLVKALVEAGAIYYSDEFAVLDRDGRVHPYPRPLNVRPTAGAVKGVPLPVEAIGGEVGHEPLEVAWVIATQYVPGKTWRPARLSAAETFLRLWDNTVIAKRRPGQAAPVLRRAVLRAQAVRSQRDDAKDVAEWLLATIERQPNQTEGIGDA